VIVITSNPLTFVTQVRRGFTVQELMHDHRLRREEHDFG
jgi:hypothetical protein